jgi:outer membrane protein TolC
VKLIGDLRDLRKLSLLFSLSILANSSSLGDILSKNRIDLIEAQSQKSKIEAKKLENSWINPIRVEYSKNYSTQFSGTTSTGQFVISVNQPIFKMGGILEAIDYARALGRVNELDIELQKQSLITNALEILFNLRRAKLNRDKLKLLIQNDELDIIIQKSNYEAGVSNRTLYDKALLKRNQDKTSLLDLEMSIEKLRADFRLLSDKDPEEIELPTFSMIDRDRYINSNLELQKGKSKIEEQLHNYKMVRTKYLPELSINGRYVDEDKNPLFASANIKSRYYTYGFSVSIPISINSIRDIESSKIDYLNSQIEQDETKKSILNEYLLTKKRVEIIKKKIELSKDDELSYLNIYESSKELELAGDGTSYETQIAKNSANIRALDQKIYAIDMELELLKLYAKVADAYR